MKTVGLALALTLILSPVVKAAAQERLTENIDLPFVSDPAVMGAWESVDIVDNPGQFNPKSRRFTGNLELKELIFRENGKTTEGWWTWTKGALIHHDDKTAAKYEIKGIGGTPYMFLEWKSGDYTIRRMKPKYYVLKKLGSLRADNINLPFVDDPRVIGRWESVDFVKTPDLFDPVHQAWRGDLYLKGLAFLKGGKTSQGWWTWTKGALIHHGDKTAAKYEIKNIGGTEFMFLEWKSGDYVFRGREPFYYVLKRVKK